MNIPVSFWSVQMHRAPGPGERAGISLAGDCCPRRAKLGWVDWVPAASLGTFSAVALGDPLARFVARPLTTFGLAFVQSDLLLAAVNTRAIRGPNRPLHLDDFKRFSGCLICGVGPHTPLGGDARL